MEAHFSAFMQLRSKLRKYSDSLAKTAFLRVAYIADSDASRDVSMLIVDRKGDDDVHPTKCCGVWYRGSIVGACILP
jgi:hypothetical protein